MRANVGAYRIEEPVRVSQQLPHDYLVLAARRDSRAGASSQHLPTGPNTRRNSKRIANGRQQLARAVPGAVRSAPD